MIDQPPSTNSHVVYAAGAGASIGFSGVPTAPAVTAGKMRYYP